MKEVAQKRRMWHKSGGGGTEAEEVAKNGSTWHKSGSDGPKVEEVDICGAWDTKVEQDR